MINRDEILLKEKENDGKSVFLYYDDIIGLYLAFGPSAYYTTMVTDPYMSYSGEMEMPVALLRRHHINSLRQSLNKLEHTVKQYYHFQLRTTVGEEGYERWAQQKLTKHQSIYR